MSKLVPIGINNIINDAEVLGLVREVLQTVQNIYEIREFEQTKRGAIRAELEYKIAQVESNTKIIIKQLELNHEERTKLIDRTFDLLDKICSNNTPYLAEIGLKTLEYLVRIMNSPKNIQIEESSL